MIGWLPRLFDHRARLRARLRDPAVRAEILGQPSSEYLLSIMPPLQRPIADRFDRQYVLGDPPDYEPDESRSIAAMAAKTNLTPEEFCYDYLTGADGERMLYYPIVNYVFGDHGVVREMLTDPATILGLGDGGAHCGLICDASLTTHMLARWADRGAAGHHGEGMMSLEQVVHSLTARTAETVGLTDRGQIALGLRADFNVIDIDRIGLHRPEAIGDLPGGATRIGQRASGYDATIVAGEVTRRGGIHTGALPGRLVRGSQVQLH